MKLRLVRQINTRRIGEGSIPINDVWYILQTRERDEDPWTTVPVVLWDDLSSEEQREIYKVMQ